MPNEPIIRIYKPSDFDAVLQIFRLNTPAFFAADEEQDLAYYLQHEMEQYFVIEVDGRVVGSGGINFSDDESIGKLSWDVLHPDFQKQGLGSKLVEYRLDVLDEYPHIEKIVVRTSQLACRFYEKHGFKTTDVQKDYWGEGLDLYVMEIPDLMKG